MMTERARVNITRAMASRACMTLVVAVAVVALTGCAGGSDSTNANGQNYVSGDGTVSEFAPANRGEPIEFAADTDLGEAVSAEQFRGDVLVVNFWYASCPPCRREAPWLEELYQQFLPEGVQFLGVNVRDSAATSRAFAEAFAITYPSVIDDQADVTAAFAGIASPSAVPTTVVLDPKGRPAARIVGLIEPSTLEALIEAVLAEDASS